MMTKKGLGSYVLERGATVISVHARLVQPSDIDRVVIAGNGSNEPVGILNTPGLRAVYVREDVAKHIQTLLTPRDLMIGPPSMGNVLGPEGYYSTACVGTDGGERVILVDPATCYADYVNGRLAFSARLSNAIVLGGWN